MKRNLTQHVFLTSAFAAILTACGGAEVETGTSATSSDAGGLIDWAPVASAVEQQNLRDGSVAFRGEGLEGFKWLRERLQAEIDTIEAEARTASSDDAQRLRSKIDQYETRLAEVDLRVEDLEKSALERRGYDYDYSHNCYSYVETYTSYWYVYGYAEAYCRYRAYLYTDVYLDTDYDSDYPQSYVYDDYTHVYASGYCHDHALVDAISVTPYTWSWYSISGCH